MGKELVSNMTLATTSLLLALATPQQHSKYEHEHQQANATILVEMYSDAQCPCSAQFQSDIKLLLDDPEFSTLDFRMWFVGGGVAGTEPGKCIHGEGECVGQRFFVCAQNMSRAELHLPPNVSPGMFGPSYRSSQTWLDFQHCAYGKCDGSPAILGGPCKTYTTFNEFTKNDIMKNCAVKLGLNWGDLSACGSGPRGQMLLTQSGTVSKDRHIKYGLQGLPVVHVNGVEIKTHKPIPVVCGPSAHVGSDGSSPGPHPEVLEHICSLLKAQGVQAQKCQKYNDAA